MHDFWFQISTSIASIEALHEDEDFSHRELAALVASKVRRAAAGGGLPLCDQLGSGGTWLDDREGLEGLALPALLGWVGAQRKRKAIISCILLLLTGLAVELPCLTILLCSTSALLLVVPGVLQPG